YTRALDHFISFLAVKDRILPNTSLLVNPFFKNFKKRKEDSFSSVKPTRIFSLPKFVFDTKNDSRYQFYCLLFLQKY
ncbi:hypothetical protein, partial [Holdemanella biformis]